MDSAMSVFMLNVWTLEFNLQFSDVFRGYRSGTLVENGLRNGKLTYQKRG